jgi:hypothetical protein
MTILLKQSAANIINFGGSLSAELLSRIRRSFDG